MRFLLLLVASALMGQTIEVPSLFQPASLDGRWKHHNGDDPRWADPAFDDSDWGTEPMPEAVRLPRNQSAWYRVRVNLPAVLPQEPLAILLGAFGNGYAYEVFLNGQFAGCLSDPAGSLWSLRLPSVQAFPVPGHPRGLVIALRMRSAFVPYTSIAGRGHDGSLIGTREAIENRRQAWPAGRLRQMLPLVMMATCIAMSGLYFLLLPLWRPDSQAFFWFGMVQLLGLLTRVPVAYPESFGFEHSFAVSLLVMVAGGTLTFCWFRFLATLFVSQRTSLAWMILGGSVLFHVFPPLCVALGTPLTVAESSVSNILVTLGTILLYGELGWRAARPPFPMPAIHTAICIYLAASLAAFGGNIFLPSDTVFLAGVQMRTATLLLFSFAMAILLNQLLGRLADERRRMAQELAAAARAQNLLLTHRALSTDSFSIEAVTLPAAEVGGDFYQVVERDDGSRLVLVGDVSGKGLEAAMMAAVAVGAFRCVQSDSPAVILAAMNQALVGHGRSGFVTCCCVMLLNDGQVILANAGHPAPYRQDRELDCEAALPLGLVPGVVYPETRTHLASDAQLMLFSDGVVEAANAQGELFGFDRTRDISTQPAPRIAAAAKAWGQTDDITVVTVRRATA